MTNPVGENKQVSEAELEKTVRFFGEFPHWKLTDEWASLTLRALTELQSLRHSPSEGVKGRSINQIVAEAKADGEVETLWAVWSVSGAHIGLWEYEATARAVFDAQYSDGALVPLVRLSDYQALKAERDELAERLGPVDPGRSDRIDELESANDFLRHRVKTAEAKLASLHPAPSNKAVTVSEEMVERAARAIAFDEWSFATDAERTAWAEKHWTRYSAAARSALAAISEGEL